MIKNGSGRLLLFLDEETERNLALKFKIYLYIAYRNLIIVTNHRHVRPHSRPSTIHSRQKQNSRSNRNSFKSKCKVKHLLIGIP